MEETPQLSAKDQAMSRSDVNVPRMADSAGARSEEVKFEGNSGKAQRKESSDVNVSTGKHVDIKIISVEGTPTLSIVDKQTGNSMIALLPSNTEFSINRDGVMEYARGEESNKGLVTIDPEVVQRMGEYAIPAIIHEIGHASIDQKNYHPEPNLDPDFINRANETDEDKLNYIIDEINYRNRDEAEAWTEAEKIISDNKGKFSVDPEKFRELKDNAITSYVYRGIDDLAVLVRDLDISVDQTRIIDTDIVDLRTLAGMAGVDLIDGKLTFGALGNVRDFMWDGNGRDPSPIQDVNQRFVNFGVLPNDTLPQEQSHIMTLEPIGAVVSQNPWDKLTEQLPKYDPSALVMRGQEQEQPARAFVQPKEKLQEAVEGRVQEMKETKGKIEEITRGMIGKIAEVDGRYREAERNIGSLEGQIREIRDKEANILSELKGDAENTPKDQELKRLMDEKAALANSTTPPDIARAKELQTQIDARTNDLKTAFNPDNGARSAIPAIRQQIVQEERKMLDRLQEVRDIRNATQEELEKLQGAALEEAIRERQKDQDETARRVRVAAEGIDNRIRKLRGDKGAKAAISKEYKDALNAANDFRGRVDQLMDLQTGQIRGENELDRMLNSIELDAVYDPNSGVGTAPIDAFIKIDNVQKKYDKLKNQVIEEELARMDERDAAADPSVLEPAEVIPRLSRNEEMARAYANRLMADRLDRLQIEQEISRRYPGIDISGQLDAHYDPAAPEARRAAQSREIAERIRREGTPPTIIDVSTQTQPVSEHRSVSQQESDEEPVKNSGGGVWGFIKGFFGQTPDELKEAYAEEDKRRAEIKDAQKKRDEQRQAEADEKADVRRRQRLNDEAERQRAADERRDASDRQRRERDADSQRRQRQTELDKNREDTNNPPDSPTSTPRLEVAQPAPQVVPVSEQSRGADAQASVDTSKNGNRGSVSGPSIEEPGPSQPGPSSSDLIERPIIEKADETTPEVTAAPTSKDSRSDESLVDLGYVDPREKKLSPPALEKTPPPTIDPVDDWEKKMGVGGEKGSGVSPIRNENLGILKGKISNLGEGGMEAEAMRLAGILDAGVKGEISNETIERAIRAADRMMPENMEERNTGRNLGPNPIVPEKLIDSQIDQAIGRIGGK